ncbi:hypothetical protein CVT26_011743, partial [Gymnopilus dilepis]
HLWYYEVEIHLATIAGSQYTANDIPNAIDQAESGGGGLSLKRLTSPVPRLRGLELQPLLLENIVPLMPAVHRVSPSLLAAESSLSIRLNEDVCTLVVASGPTGSSTTRMVTFALGNSHLCLGLCSQMNKCSRLLLLTTLHPGITSFHVASEGRDKILCPGRSWMPRRRLQSGQVKLADREQMLHE